MKDFTLSPLFCLYNNVLVLEQNSESVILGICDIENFELKTKITNSFISFENGNPRELIYKQISKEECKKRIAIMLSEAKIEKEDLHQEEKTDFSDSPTINFLEALFIECLEDNKISDIHFEPFLGEYRIRIRKAGELVFYKSISKELYLSISRRIKLLCNLNSGDSRIIQDGSFKYEVLSLKADIRCSFIPVFQGESLVLRLLRSGSIPPDIKDLGFSNEQVALLKREITKSSNLILICGATGAGKTTTLASLLNLLKENNQKIITIEDPVEYNIPGICQIQVSKDLGLDFNQVLKSAFRQDPDVLMIGEIRDEETAQIAVRAALTGHLVFATLHTKDSSNAISRLLDLGVKPYLLASVLGLVLAQKLVKCDGGKRKAEGEILENSEEVKNLILEKASAQDFDLILKKRKIKRIWEKNYE